MNTKRFAELLRVRAELQARLAEADAELAAVVLENEAANDTPSAVPLTKRTKITTVALPDNEPTDLGQKRADAALRKLGYRVR